MDLTLISNFRLMSTMAEAFSNTNDASRKHTWIKKKRIVNTTQSDELKMPIHQEFFRFWFFSYFDMVKINQNV